MAESSSEPTITITPRRQKLFVLALRVAGWGWIARAGLAVAYQAMTEESLARVVLELVYPASFWLVFGIILLIGAQFFSPEPCASIATGPKFEIDSPP